MNRIKEYLEYRRNKKIAKRELAKLAATNLPVVNDDLQKFKEDNGRIFEIINYIATLSPDEIQKILVHSIVETMPDDKE